MAEGPPSRQIGRFDELEVHDLVCTFGPQDRSFRRVLGCSPREMRRSRVRRLAPRRPGG